MILISHNTMKTKVNKMSNNDSDFIGIRWADIADLRLSQIYLNAEKLKHVETWFNPSDLTNFQPLPVHDFGNGHLTLTDGHSRAFIAYKSGLSKIPIIYDYDELVTSKTAQMLYKNDIVWCERFNLKSISDLGDRIISDEKYRRLWIERCDRAYDLLTQTTAQQRKKWQQLHMGLFLYGASEDLKTLFFEDKNGKSFEFLSGI